VRQVVPTADRQRATVQVKVSITDRDARILPEMGAKVDFLEADTARPAAAGAAPRAIVRVPSAAVVMDQGAQVVWLVREGRLVRRSVDAGPVSAGFREVRSGLNGGEQVVIGGAANPREGMRVKTR
jgi:HlyD family secretion protein